MKIVKVLIIGSGSKEHALIWKLLASEKYRHMEILVAPGNLALGRMVECVDVDINDTDRLLDIAIARNINLTIVGEPKLFAQGIVDKFRTAGKLIFGPTRAASEIEWSNFYSKDLLYRYSIPCAKFVAFDNLNIAQAFLNTANFPLKIRADKEFEWDQPMLIARDFKEGRAIVKDFFKQKFLSREQTRVIFEECLEGHAFTINTICDGKRALSLPPVQAYRDFNENSIEGYADKGAYAPTPILTDYMMRRIRHEIINPTLAALREEGTSLHSREFTGLLAFDIILDANDSLKPKLIQYRTSFADSDAQVVLPLLDEDLFEVLSSSANLDLGFYQEGFHKFMGSALAVNIVAGDSYSGSIGRMQNLELLEHINSQIDQLQGSLNGIPLMFYGLTNHKDSRQLGMQSEIFGATAVAESLIDAQILAYKLADTIAVPSKYYERNIGDQGML